MIFLKKEVKFVEKVSVINGWKVWQLGEAGGCYYI